MAAAKAELRRINEELRTHWKDNGGDDLAEDRHRARLH